MATECTSILGYAAQKGQNEVKKVLNQQKHIF